ncbi:MAG: ArsS family sensor histidine kinase [Campylobacterales bacterium]|nr:ArsS family sensor histidine kinase [Campylobacterales bacterium]
MKLFNLRKNSIIFPITSFFIISVISILGFFSILIFFDYKKESHKQDDRINRAIKTIYIFKRRGYPDIALLEQLKALEFALAKPQEFRGLEPCKVRERRKHYVEFYGEEELIRVITKNGDVFLFKDLRHKTPYFPFLFFGLFASLLITIFSYLAVIKKLKPLNTLEESVKEFGQGSLDISLNIKGDDEISRLAKSFTDALANIKMLKGSRDFFIRNIMHELKTPIAKGKITLELLDDQKNKERLTKVFHRLENLINELASVESIISGSNGHEKRDYRVIDLIDGAKDLMFEQDLDVEIEGVDKTIFCDYTLFTILFKNLIDNGVKHSVDSKVYVKQNGDTLEFINYGHKMKKDLEELTKPFEKTESAGFGLGLYIVDTILTRHEKKLHYRYEEGKSIFYF